MFLTIKFNDSIINKLCGDFKLSIDEVKRSLQVYSMIDVLIESS